MLVSFNKPEFQAKSLIYILKIDHRGMIDVYKFITVQIID